MSARLISRRMAFTTPLLASLLLLGACGEGREAEPTPIRDGPPADRVSNPATGVPAPADPSGVWRQETVDGSPALVFGATASESLVRLSCHGRGGIVLERLGQDSIGNIEMMELQVGTEVARLALNEVETQEQILRSVIPFNHGLMTSLSRPDGVLSIKAGETPAVRVPLNARTAELLLTCEQPQGGDRG